MGAHPFETVEHQHGRSGQPAKEFLEIPPGKTGNTREILGGKNGERFFFARGGFLRSQTQVMEKCRDVRIVFVDLIPQARDLACLEITVYQGRLSGTRRPRDPEDGVFLQIVQLPEQSFPLEMTDQDGSADLDDRCRIFTFETWFAEGGLSDGRFRSRFYRWLTFHKHNFKLIAIYIPPNIQYVT